LPWDPRAHDHSSAPASLCPAAGCGPLLSVMCGPRDQRGSPVDAFSVPPLLG
jgi:hypothetical protein